MKNQGEHWRYHSFNRELTYYSRRLSQYRYKYLRQAVTLGGLGTPTFTNACVIAQDFHARFDQHFREGALQQWSPTTDSEEGSYALDLSNCYFTPISEAQGLDAVEFEPGVDPKGILQSMTGRGGTQMYVHTDDNVVRYYKTRIENGIKRWRICTKKGKDSPIMARYVMCEPQSFRLGDIVQAQLSFVVVPMKGDRYQMLSTLRSLALIDGQFGQVESLCGNIAPTITTH